MQKNIIICADDFALSEEISDAILELAHKERISAISCLTSGKKWKQLAPQLSALQDKVDIGLHINFTEGTLFSLPPSKHLTLMAHAFFKKISSKQIEAEIHQQLEAFTHQLGRLPDFIDGHQHVHTLPVIRNALLNVYKAAKLPKSIYIRVPLTKEWGIKSYIIAQTGAHKLKRLLTLHDIPFNAGFSGIYNFHNAKHYPQYFRNFLKKSSENGIIMCHPGKTHFRQHEYAYLKSTHFLADCATQNIVLSRFRQP